MNAPVTLTVGIPTFNRASAVLARVRELLAISDRADFQILVIDNASEDGTYELLAEGAKGANIVLLRNERNLGYAGNFLRLIEAVDTDYLTVVSDEDMVEPEGLAGLIGYLHDHRPRFASPRAQVGADPFYRGRRTTQQIEPEDFEAASFYISGLTFEVESARRYAQRVSRLIPTNAAAVVYPQVLVGALAIAEGDSVFLDTLVTRQVVELETYISSDVVGAYRFVPARWAQFEGYERFFVGLSEECFGVGDSVARMRSAQRRGVFNLMESGVIAQFPELAEYRPSQQTKSLGARLGDLLRRFRR